MGSHIGLWIIVYDHAIVKRNLSYQIRRSQILLSIMSHFMTKMTSKDYYLVTKWDGRCVTPSSSEFEQ